MHPKGHIGQDEDVDNRMVRLVNRVIDGAIEALDRDPVPSSITREDARTVRDQMLDWVKVTGKGVGGKVSSSTVSRELSITTAMINFAMREFDVADAVKNQFSQLPVSRVAKGQQGLSTVRV